LLKPSALKIFKIRHLPLTTVESRDAAGNPITRKEDEPYGTRPLLNSDTLAYVHFPSLLLADGSPWRHGNLYLLSKISESDNRTLVDSETLRSIASELKHFINALNEAGLDYLTFPTRKLQRPTYFYKSRLKKMVDAGQITQNTEDKKLGCVVGFYNWLKNQHDFNPEHSLWDETTKIINYIDDKGFTHTKIIRKNNLRKTSLRASQTGLDGYIRDGGQLRPYAKNEQTTLINCLIESGNTELLLMCIFALVTGARLQTVLTLRKEHIVTHGETNGRNIKLIAGPGTNIDTKGGKPLQLLVPDWLHKKLFIYINSPRYAVREAKASEDVKKGNYVFLTSDGNPHYMAKNDPAKASYVTPPTGDAMRQAVRRELQPLLDSSETPFNFRFHDLRATFGMNLVNDIWGRIDNKNDMSFMQAIKAVQERMGHSKSSTTLQYFNYKSQMHDIFHSCTSFESYLQEMI